MNIESQVKKALKQIASKKAKVLVAASGGKDSQSLIYILHKLGYKIEALYINLHLGKYSEECKKAIEELCNKLKVKLHIFNIKDYYGCSMCHIRQSVQSKVKVSNCMICGVVKKSILNKEARIKKADYIATGHNLDDEAQTLFINFLKGNPELSLNSGIISGLVEDKKFIPRIKPLFYVPEKEIRKFAIKQKIPFIAEKCPCAKESYRLETRAFLNGFDNKIKDYIVKNLEKVKDKLSGKIKIGKVIYCQLCGEPCRNKICKSCELLSEIKN
jgi:uncharacterized protein (TIGR00269 family)